MRRWAPGMLAFGGIIVSAACVGPNTSYVAEVEKPGDVRVLADDMAGFIAVRLPASDSPVILDPPLFYQSDNAFTPALADALRRRGFAVADDGQQMRAEAHHVRYFVTSLDNGTLARLKIDGSAEGARFFARDAAGGLKTGGPLTVTQADAAP